MMMTVWDSQHHPRRQAPGKRFALQTCYDDAQTMYRVYESTMKQLTQSETLKSRIVEREFDGHVDQLTDNHTIYQNINSALLCPNLLFLELESAPATNNLSSNSC